jgi:hypothetical protein
MKCIRLRPRRLLTLLLLTLACRYIVYIATRWNTLDSPQSSQVLRHNKVDISKQNINNIKHISKITLKNGLKPESELDAFIVEEREDAGGSEFGVTHGEFNEQKSDDSDVDDEDINGDERYLYKNNQPTCFGLQCTKNQFFTMLENLLIASNVHTLIYQNLLNCITRRMI